MKQINRLDALDDELDCLGWQEKFLDDQSDLVFFVVPGCHGLVLDGSINIFKLFHTPRSAVD